MSIVPTYYTHIIIYISTFYYSSITERRHPVGVILYYIGIKIQNYSVGANVGGELEAEIQVQKNKIDSWHITY